MATRILTLPAAVLALIPAPLAAQDTTGTLPDPSWADVGLVEDPAESVRNIVGRVHNGDAMSLGNIFLMGCVAESKWTAAVFNGLERAAETDSAVRNALVYGIRSQWILDKCAMDYPRTEALLARYLREAHVAGPVTGMGGLGGIGEVVWLLGSKSDDPEVYALVSEVLHDATVHLDVRELAWEGLAEMRRRIHGETWAVADSTVRSDAGEAVFSGQDIRKKYRIPDDPMDFVREVRESPPIPGGMVAVATGIVLRDPADLFKVCAADGEWAAATFAALEQAAETDSVVRRRIGGRIGLYWHNGVYQKNTDRCGNVGYSRIERLLARYLREDLEAGWFAASSTTEPVVLIRTLEVSSDPQTYALVRQILHDTTVAELSRFEAFVVLTTIHRRLYDETFEVADSAVRADACGANGLPFGYCVVPSPVLLGLDTTTYALPDSVRHLRLSTNPADFVREVQMGRADGRGRRSPAHLFEVGCVADGGWPEAVFNALERFSEVNLEVRQRFAGGLGTHWVVNVEGGYDRCTVDHLRIEALLTRYLREDYEAGRLSGGYGPGVVGGVLRDLEASDNPETYALVRDILYDETVARLHRERAWSTLAGMRQRMYGETGAVADSTIVTNAEKAGIDLTCVPLLADCFQVVGPIVPPGKPNR